MPTKKINPEEHIGLVWDEVRRMQKSFWRVDKEDLFQWGFVGLLHASKRFKKSRGVKFSTFARPCIFGYMMRAVAELDWVPREIRRRRKRDGEFIPETFDSDLSGNPLGLADPTENVGHQVENQDSAERLLKLLNDRQRRVIRARLFEHRKLREIAAAMHITREYVRQIENQAMAIMRRACGVDPDQVSDSLRHFVD